MYKSYARLTMADDTTEEIVIKSNDVKGLPGVLMYKGKIFVREWDLPFDNFFIQDECMVVDRDHNGIVRTDLDILDKPLTKEK